jgi:hypothetical protein
MDPIVEQARRFDISVIEDAAQAIGARYPSRDGLRRREVLPRGPRRSGGSFGSVVLRAGRDSVPSTAHTPEARAQLASSTRSIASTIPPS